MSDKDWKDLTKGLLKAELAKRNINYIELSKRLEKIGVHESSQNLSNKIARGTFSATFLVQVLSVIGCETLTISD